MLANSTLMRSTSGNTNEAKAQDWLTILLYMYLGHIQTDITLKEWIGIICKAKALSRISLSLLLVSPMWMCWSLPVCVQGYTILFLFIHLVTSCIHFGCVCVSERERKVNEELAHKESMGVISMVDEPTLGARVQWWSPKSQVLSTSVKTWSHSMRVCWEKSTHCPKSTRTLAQLTKAKGIQ